MKRLLGYPDSDIPRKLNAFALQAVFSPPGNKTSIPVASVSPIHVQMYLQYVYL